MDGYNHRVAEGDLPVVTLRIARTGAILARVEVAATSSTRRTGLLGRTGLEPGTGLLIRPCSMIHTWFMRFPIDAVFTDRGGTVVEIAEHVGPFRLAWGGWRARDTIELPAGVARAKGLVVGDTVS